MQNLAEIVAFEAVAAEYAVPIQVAGLRTGLIDVCRDNAETPAQLRRSLVRQLQRTLPKSVPTSIRADATRMPDAEFSKTEARVKAAVIEHAHQSPELRSVTTKNRSGVEEVSFYGQKGSWMRQFADQPRLMKAIGGAPVRLPTIIS